MKIQPLTEGKINVNLEKIQMMELVAVINMFEKVEKIINS